MIINISYDSSVNSAPAAFRAAVTSAIQFLDNIFTNPITINIDVGYGEVNSQPLDSGALGESETFFDNYTYTQIRSALAQNATSADQISAVNTLPASDPTNGGHYWMATAEAKALALVPPGSGPDGFVGFSNSVAFDYDDSNGVSPGTYDFYGTFLHEVTEVMGRGLFVGSAGIGPNAYTPLDLFHYSSSGTRTFSGTTTGYFSLNDGATNLDNFNTNPNGDFGDWAASAGNDSFLAFSNSGVVNAVTQADLRVMNVLGYNETSTPPVTPTVATTSNDFNGDALADLILQNTSNNSVMIDLMNGASVTSSVTIANSGGLQVKATGDFSHDNKTDIVLQSGIGTPQIWFMNGTSVTGTAALPDPGPAWHVIATGDFNTDGNTDILWQNNDGSPSIWLMNGTSVTGWGALPNPGPSWHAIGTGDFNGDGHSDILWQNSDGSPSIWEMNGGSVTGWDALPNPGPTWHVIGSGDFNADGKADILWQNNDGSPSIWEMNGGSVIGWGALPNPGPTWHVIKTSDFNGDGHSDILWQNNDGTPAVWFMNGTTIAQWGGSLPDPGSTWHLKGNGPNASEPAIDDATPLQNNENPNLIVAGGDPGAPQPTLFSGNETGAPPTHPTIGSSV